MYKGAYLGGKNRDPSIKPNNEKMSRMTPITFVVSVSGNREIFENNFLASPCFREPHPHQIIIQEGFRSAARAYNDAIEKSVNDLIVFAHQDILFPAAWPSDLQCALDHLEVSDPNWGVLGCYGETLHDNGRGYVYSPGRGILGKPFDRPEVVQTLDEIVLILRKSTKELRFDERLPHFHFYGADICMTAAKQGRKNYAISALCIHNTEPRLILSKEFYESYKVMKRIWKKSLPIRTTCILISRFDKGVYVRKLAHPYLRYFRRKEVIGTRVKDGRQLLREIEFLSAAPGGSTK